MMKYVGYNIGQCYNKLSHFIKNRVKADLGAFLAAKYAKQYNNIYIRMTKGPKYNALKGG